jgi:hypothetical protein
VLTMKQILISFLVTILCVLLLASRTERVIPGVIAVTLFGDCQVEFYDTTIQPVFTLALACPRVDVIRLWPFPVKQPWNEKQIPIYEKVKFDRS